jgi:hypothetical protein
MAELAAAAARELRIISDSLSRLADALQKTSGTAPDDAASPRRRLSPEHRRALELHGRYLNLLSRLDTPAKARVKVRRKRQGVEAAITLARRLAAAD